jgi:hypothetical protein
MGIPTPSFIPAAVMARQRRILRKFEEAGADRAERARAPGELEIRDTHLFGRLVRSGVLATVDGSRYFVSAEGLARWRRRRRVAVLVSAALVAIGLLLAFALAGRS